MELLTTEKAVNQLKNQTKTTTKTTRNKLFRTRQQGDECFHKAVKIWNQNLRLMDSDNSFEYLEELDNIFKMLTTAPRHQFSILSE